METACCFIGSTVIDKCQCLDLCFSWEKRDMIMFPRVLLTLSIPLFPIEWWGVDFCTPVIFKSSLVRRLSTLVGVQPLRETIHTDSFWSTYFAVWFMQGKAWPSFVKWSVITNTSTVPPAVFSWPKSTQTNWKGAEVLSDSNGALASGSGALLKKHLSQWYT